MKKQADRILSTFQDHDKSTGVLLAGEKGSGKTFLAKWISIQAAKLHDIPTVVINQALSGERFNSFIQSIQQPTVFLFDEFEKIYSGNQANMHYTDMDMEEEYNMMGRRRAISNPTQDSMLSLLDGTYPAKMIFLLTTNDKFRVSSNMHNCPGRIFYVIDFTGLSADFVQEYCEDNLKDKTMLSQVIAISALFSAFNFDMLQAMVEEMNRYGETPEEVLSYLNVRPEFGGGSRYKITLNVEGQEIKKQQLHSGEHWFGNPLISAVHLHFSKVQPRGSHRPIEKPVEDDDNIILDHEYYHGDYLSTDMSFTANDIDGMDSRSGTFWYWKEEEQARLVLQKIAGNSMFQGMINLQKLSTLGNPTSSVETGRNEK